MKKLWYTELVDDVARLPLFLPVTLKILVVADQSVTFNTSFGLGMMIDTLRANAYSFVRFDVTLARRDGPQTTVASPGPHEPKYRGFRFNQTEPDGTPTLHKFDQVWCFGFAPGNDGSTSDANINAAVNADGIPNNPTSNAELATLTRWMNERQGGVFATGDHHYLGASMCHRIPRVGTMRKWTNAQGVPPIGGLARHDTNRPATPGQANIAGSPDVMPFDNQSDTVPQQIEWKRYASPSWSPFLRNYSPHPILCDSKRGVIDILPDHPHEGWIIEDADIVKTNTYNFNGYTGDEYPTVSGVRPLPEVIAWAHTLPDPPYNHQKGDSPAKRFGVIGIYDGQQIGIGRVVVDATWHHWMDVNLVGMAADTTTNHYERVQTYFRNVGIWLATAAQRSRMLFVASWTSMFTVQAVQEYGKFVSVWEVGSSAIDILGRHASRCLVREWVLERLDKLFVREILKFPPRPDPCLSCPPFEIFELSILGSVIKEMLPEFGRVQSQRFENPNEVPKPDEQAVAKAVREGVSVGLRELTRVYKESLDRGAEFLKALDRLNRQETRRDRERQLSE